jgi:hypothetical protein
MILSIHDNLLISDLQERFSKCYPQLKIEFYTGPHRNSQASGNADQLDPHQRIGDIRRLRNEGQLEVYSFFTVAQLEQKLETEFGLHVQVFRNENGAWIQTTKTDSFTLRQQCEMSLHAQHSIDPKVKDQLQEYEEL